jgi:hypothetical protein
MKIFQNSTWLVILASLITSGCSSIPLPKYAKPNDFVTVPIGGAKTVANSNYLDSSDLEVTIIDSLGQEFPTFITRLYRVYADPSSRYALAINDPGSELNGVVYANEGQWMLQFVMPASNALSQIPEPGPATVSIVSTEVNPDPDPKKRRINTDVKTFNTDLSVLSFEILPGTGGTHISETRGGQYLTVGRTILAQPDDETALLNNVGGAVYVFQYSTDAFLSNALPYAVKNSPDQHIQLATSRKDLGGNMTELTAIVINPNGFYDDASWGPGKSYYDGLYVAMSWDPVPYGASEIVDDTNWQSYVTLVPTKSYYIDLNGNIIPNVSPVLSKVR